MRIDPILKLGNGEEVRTLFRDGADGPVLVGTSSGRILLIRHLTTNAYMMGNRTAYAQIMNGVGGASQVSTFNFKHGIQDKIVEMTSGITVTRWKDVKLPLGAEAHKTVSGIFTTPVLWAGEDFGWWGDMSWVQTLNPDCRVAVSLRIATSKEALLSSVWRTHESQGDGAQSWTIDEMSTAGGYAQVRIVMESAVTGSTPNVSNLVIPYYARHASYFFLTKLSMKKGTAIKGGLLTASVSVPKNTAVKWGISGGNSQKWENFSIMEPDKLFALASNFGDRMKIGAKLLSYDDERYPSINEFSVAFDSDMDNLVNQL